MFKINYNDLHEIHSEVTNNILMPALTMNNGKIELFYRYNIQVFRQKEYLENGEKLITEVKDSIVTITTFDGFLHSYNNEPSRLIETFDADNNIISSLSEFHQYGLITNSNGPCYIQSCDDKFIECYMENGKYKDRGQLPNSVSNIKNKILLVWYSPLSYINQNNPLVIKSIMKISKHDKQIIKVFNSDNELHCLDGAAIIKSLNDIIYEKEWWIDGSLIFKEIIGFKL